MIVSFDKPLIFVLWPDELSSIIDVLDQHIQSLIIHHTDPMDIFYYDSIKELLMYKREVSENV